MFHLFNDIQAICTFSSLDAGQLLEILFCIVGFTMQICSKSEWGSTSTVLMFMLYCKMIGNCTYSLRNTRPTHTVNI